MKRVAPVLVPTISVSLAILLVFSLSPLLTDAAAILDSPGAAAASLGNSFEIKAIGEAIANTTDGSVRALTKMHLEFTIVRNGTRGVLFQVNSGYLVMNYTRYEIQEGIGLAGRPREGRFNNTIVFGFRVNLTGYDGDAAQLVFRGFVARNEAKGPILYMQGRITLESVQYYLIQRGNVHRIKT